MSTLTQFMSSGSSGGVKSIQSGFYNNNNGLIGSGEDLYYRDVTISSVVVAKCVVMIQSNIYGNQPTLHTGRLIGSTTLRLSRNADYSIIMGRWTVIEYF